MEVMGILVRGKDGNEYLLGAAKRATGKTIGPFIKRRDGSTWTSLEETRNASGVIREQLLDVSEEKLKNHDDHVKRAVMEALSAFLEDFLKTARWGG